MANGKPKFIGCADDGVVDVVIGDTHYRYSGVDVAVYEKRFTTYKYKPWKLVNWLKNNSSDCEACKKENEKDPIGTISPLGGQSRLYAIEWAKNIIKQAGFVLATKGVTVRAVKCDECGKTSALYGEIDWTQSCKKRHIVCFNCKHITTKNITF